MHEQREFIAPMNALEASQRAQYVLRRWKYRHLQNCQGLRFERGKPGSALVAVNPHHVHARIDLFLTEQRDSTCRVVVEQRVFKLGQPCSNLDKLVWRGDLDDVQAALTRRADLSVDRVRQDRYAASVSYKYLAFVVTPPLIALLWLVFNDRWIGVAAMGALLAIVAFVLPLLPFQMPEFKLENTVPEFPSNYLRN